MWRKLLAMKKNQKIKVHTKVNYWYQRSLISYYRIQHYNLKILQSLSLKTL